MARKPIGADVEVTAQMIDAAAAVLSDRLDLVENHARWLVADLVEAMIAACEPPRLVLKREVPKEQIAR